MLERDFRIRNIPAYRRIVSTTRGSRVPRSTPETRCKIHPKAAGGRLLRQWENAQVLKSSKSEPLLWNGSAREEVDEEEEEAAVLYRRQTCRDIFSSRGFTSPQSTGKYSQVYNKDAKVVVSVTVEGSPGPVRTMVKLRSTVEEMIRLVINKYNEEGRTPPLHKDAAAKFELHHTYFSLERLSKSDLIGDIGGSRSFYLRKCSSNGSDVSTSSNHSSLSFLPSFIGRNITIFIIKTRNFWKIFGCIPW